MRFYLVDERPTAQANEEFGKEASERAGFGENGHSVAVCVISLCLNITIIIKFSEYIWFPQSRKAKQK